MASQVMSSTEIRPSSLGAWLIAIRPKLLPAAVAPVLVGAALAHRGGAFHLMPALFVVSGALLLQVASNLANDVFDFEQGKDTSERLGPIRAVQSGLLSPAEVRTGLVVVLAGCAAVGSYLVARTGWPLAVVGLASMVAAVAYTAGPFPLGYHGLGDVFAFLFFGPVAVMGTEFAIAEIVTQSGFLASLSVGALTTNILVVNNLRDRHEDARTGKRTLAVRFGERFSVLQAAALVCIAFASPLYIALSVGSPWPFVLPALALPLTLKWLMRLRVVRGRPMNVLLAAAARNLLFFAGLFALGLWISA
jgi:1,4-dihydroxy-2-naphthoate polyprenyltransferase